MKKCLITVLLAGCCFVVHGQWERFVATSYWQNRASADDAWATYNLSNYDYDAYGNEVSRLQFMWRNGKQQVWRHTTNNYDPQQHLVNSINLVYDLDDPGTLETRRESWWTWVDDQLVGEITNEEDFVGGITHFYRESGVWGEGVRETERRTTYENGEFYYSFNRTEYNADGEIEQAYYLNEDSNSGRYEFEEKYYYTQKGCQSGRVTSEREGTGNWVRQDSSAMTYDSECRLLTSEHYQFTGQWVLYFEQRFTYTFDAAGRLVHQLNENRESDTWEFLSEKAYSFDDAGKITLEYYRNPDFEERRVYTYSDNYLVSESIVQGKTENEAEWITYVRFRDRYDDEGNTLFQGYWSYSRVTGMIDYVGLDSMLRNEAGEVSSKWSFMLYENGHYQRKKTTYSYRCDGVSKGYTETILDALPTHIIGRQERQVIEYVWSPSCAPTEFSKITVYPNPADDYLGIAFPEESEQWEVKVTDLSGKSVVSALVSGSERYFRLNTAQLKAGIYLLQLSGEAGSFTSRFVVRH